MKENGSKEIICVFGSPCSGKTTFVRQMAQKGDLIIDHDDLYMAISTLDRYERHPGIRDAVLEMKKTLLDFIRERKGYWSRAWVIDTAHSSAGRKQLMDLVGADRGVIIYADRATCLERMKERENFGGFRKTIDLYHWFFEPPGEDENVVVLEGKRR